MDQIYINIKDFRDCYFKDYLNKRFNKDLVSVDELIDLAEDLVIEI